MPRRETERVIKERVKQNNKLQFVAVNCCDRQAINIANQHNLVRADIILPRNPYNLIAAYFVGVGDLDDPLTRERHDMKL